MNSRRKPGNNAKTSREKNIALIVKLINRSGVISRAELAALTGLTQASITYITKDLIDRGLLCETGTVEGKTHHPSIGLAIDRSRYAILSVQINRSYVTAGLYALDGTQLCKRTGTFPEPPPPRVLLDRMFLELDGILGDLPLPADAAVLGIGVALPGPFLPAEGRIELMSGAPGWAEVDLHAELKERYGLPVVLEHDANCGALAELWHGNPEDRSNILYVMAADGIGAGIICDGRLYRGHIGTAGEIGHMCVNFTGPRCECGNRGCLEMYCSLRRLKADYDALLFEEGTGAAAATAEDVLTSAAAGDRLALRALERSAGYLGIGLANLTNILNPELIILADKFALAGEAFAAMTEEAMKRYLLPPVAESVSVRTATQSTEDSILCGASVSLLEQLLREPTRYLRRSAEF